MERIEILRKVREAISLQIAELSAVKEKDDAVSAALLHLECALIRIERAIFNEGGK